MGSNTVPSNIPTSPANGAALFGILALAENVPVGQADVASFAKQLGYSPNGYLWQANSLTAGDFSFANLIPGQLNVGNASNQTAGSAGNSFWYFFGNPTLQNSNLETSDGNLVMINCNPYTSGSGFSIAYVGKTNSGTFLSQNSNGENIYVHQLLAGSFIITAENGPTADMPGVVQLMAQGSLPLALVASGGGGNFSYVYGDPVNGILHIPKWVNGVFTPQTAGWIDAFTVNMNNGNITIGVAGQTVTVNGTLNTASGVAANFTPAANAGITIDASGNVNICPGGSNSGEACFNQFLFQGNFNAGAVCKFGNISGTGMGFEAGASSINVGELLAGGARVVLWGGVNDFWTPNTPSVVIGADATISNFNNVGFSTLDVRGSLGLAVNEVTANYAPTDADFFVRFNGVSLTCTLPSATAHTKGRLYVIKNVAATALVVTATAGVPDIVSLAQNKCAMYQSDGANWIALMNN